MYAMVEERKLVTVFVAGRKEGKGEEGHVTGEVKAAERKKREGKVRGDMQL